jgi:hypothetical protein
MVLDTLKKRLHDAANAKGGKWIKELPNALWGLRTQLSKPTGQSPYFLVYGSEAILPAKSCGIHQLWSNTTKAYLKIADELTSTDSKKLAVPPSSNQQGT